MRLYQLGWFSYLFFAVEWNLGLIKTLLFFFFFWGYINYLIDVYLVGLPNLLSWILIAIFHAWPWKTHTHTQINNNKKLSMIKWQIYLDVSMHTLPTRRLCPTHAMIPQRRDWALDCLLSTNQQEFSQRSIRYLIWTWSHPQLCMCSNGSEIHIVIYHTNLNYIHCVIECGVA